MVPPSPLTRDSATSVCASVSRTITGTVAPGFACTAPHSEGSSLPWRRAGGGSRRWRGEGADRTQGIRPEPDFGKPAPVRQPLVGVQLEEWDQDEGTVSHAGVRDGQAGLVDLLVAEGQHVDIDDPWPPTLG